MQVFFFVFLLFIFSTTFNCVTVIAAQWGGLIDNRDFFSGFSWPTVVNQLHLRTENTKLLRNVHVKQSRESPGWPITPRPESPEPPALWQKVQEYQQQDKQNQRYFLPVGKWLFLHAYLFISQSTTSLVTYIGLLSGWVCVS